MLGLFVNRQFNKQTYQSTDISISLSTDISLSVDSTQGACDEISQTLAASEPPNSISYEFDRQRRPVERGAARHLECGVLTTKSVSLIFKEPIKSPLHHIKHNFFMHSHEIACKEG